MWNSISYAWILFHIFENGFLTDAIQFPDYATGFPTYVNLFPTYEIGYPITEIEFPFDEITFPTNETNSKNLNSEITWMQLKIKRMKFDFTTIYSYTYDAYLFI